MAMYKVKFRVNAGGYYKYKIKTLEIDNPVDEWGFVKSKETRNILDQWGKDNVKGYAGTVWYQDINHK